MNIIDTVPRPLTWREKVQVVLSVLRNERWHSKHEKHDPKRTLYTFQKHVAEAAFRGGYVFRFQWYGSDPSEATAWGMANKCMALAESRDYLDEITEENLFSARVIRRSDLAVFHVAGKEIPRGFNI